MRKLIRAVFILLVLVAFNGCATNFELKPLPPDHPASAQAQEAPRSGMKRLTASDDLTRKTKAQLARNAVPNPDYQGGGMSHDMGNMKGMEGMDHSKMPGIKPAATIYTCVMHPEIRQATPGNCPKCGMVLVKKKPDAP